MPKLQKDWFDRLQINFNQAPDGLIGIHAYKEDKWCEYFEVPVEWLESDDFFSMIYDKTRELWAGQHKRLQIICPVCQHTFLPFHFRYKGNLYCRWCGSHYTMNGNKPEPVITRVIGK